VIVAQKKQLVTLADETPKRASVHNAAIADGNATGHGTQPRREHLRSDIAH
jgi:hypothetical protein